MEKLSFLGVKGVAIKTPNLLKSKKPLDFVAN